jgi:hypothetical protein
MFMGLTETHLKEDIVDAQIQIEGYNLFRSDRLQRPGGGVAIYMNDNLAVTTTVIRSFSNKSAELLITYTKSINLLLVILYRPPNCTNGQFDEIIQIIKHEISILSSPTPDILIMGDFNFPFMKWPHGTIPGCTTDESTGLQLDAKSTVSLQQHDVVLSNSKLDSLNLNKC